MSVCICHTAGCGNQDVPVDVTTTWTDEFGQELTLSAVVCGVCGQTVTDVSPPIGAPTEPDPEPEPWVRT